MQTCPEENTSEKDDKEFFTSSTFPCPFTSETEAVPSSPLVLLWRFSPSCLCLTACSQQHAQSYLFPALSSLSLPYMFVFTSSAFNALGSISSFGAYSVSLCPILSSLSPHVSWVLSSFHLHVLLLALYFLLLLLFFLFTSLSVSLGPDHIANPRVVFNQKPWKQSSQTLGDRCVFNSEKRQAEIGSQTQNIPQNTQAVLSNMRKRP